MIFNPYQGCVAIWFTFRGLTPTVIQIKSLRDLEKPRMWFNLNNPVRSAGL